jgi:hypothetical protein
MDKSCWLLLLLLIYCADWPCLASQQSVSNISFIYKMDIAKKKQSKCRAGPPQNATAQWSLFAIR